jgi:hypothetical protein
MHPFATASTTLVEPFGSWYGACMVHGWCRSSQVEARRGTRRALRFLLVAVAAGRCYRSLLAGCCCCLRNDQSKCCCPVRDKWRGRALPHMGTPGVATPHLKYVSIGIVRKA